MTSPLVCGIDVSPLRLGWGLVLLDDGTYVASGHADINLPPPPESTSKRKAATYRSWNPAPVMDALGDIKKAARGATVTAVGIELPHLKWLKGTFDAGRAVQAARSAVARRFPEAAVYELQPGEWRKLAGLPNTGKEPVALAAAALRPGALYPGDMSQDEADGVMIAVAAQRLNVATWDRGVERGAA